MTNRQLAVLLALGVVWGASFLFIKVIVDEGVDPIGVSAGRTTLGALTLVPIVFAARAEIPRSRRVWGLLALLGLVNFAVPWTLFALAAEHAPSGASSIANSSQPLWAAIIVTLFLRADRLTGVRAAGLAVGFLGVLVLMGRGLLHAGNSGSVAILILLLATFCYASSAVVIRRFLAGVPSVFLAAGQISFAALYLMPLALLLGQAPGPSMGANALLSLLLLGAANSGVAVIGYMWLIGEVGPVRAAVVTYLMPPVGVTLGWLVLDEPVGWNLVAGLVCVVAGVALVQQPPLRALWRRGPFGARVAAVAASAD
jgi:drug/metabolite transporter (DMT)-like permease